MLMSAPRRRESRPASHSCGEARDPQPVTVAVWLTNKQFEFLRLQPRHERRLLEALPGLDWRFCGSREEFLRALPEAQVAACWIFPDEWLPLAPRLRRIVSPTAGGEAFPLEPPPGLRLEFSRFHGLIMAETVLGMILCHARGLLAASRLQEAVAWPRQELEPGLSTVRGSRLTLLGFGAIATHIGRLAKVFGARLTGLRRSPTSPPEYFTNGDRLLPAAALESVLPETDHLVVSLPAAPDTARILEARRLALLPGHAGLYNVGRGNALDEDALASWLAARPRAAAFLDVFRVEPLPADSPLRRLPNCLILPHLAAIAPDFLDLFVEELIGRLAT
jgi:D-2-hydroxyacid dehydrogenase (NADP+)